jgi:uncharacterized protein YkwD
MKKWAILIALIGAGVLAGPGQALAAIFVVDDDGFAVPGNCAATTPTYNQIQLAVIAASPGDTIQVCPGVYPEPLPGPLTINKQLFLQGAGFGVDARTRVTAESQIQDPQGTSVSASGVVIDGFTVENSIISAFTGYGIWLNPNISGTQILNNIIQNNIAGIGLANSGATQAVIRRNLIRNNNQPGGATGSGIYTDEYVGGPITRNVLIEQNTFAAHGDGGAAINISNTDFVNGGVFDLTVRANRFDTNNRAFVLFNTHTSTFDLNTIMNSTFAGSADIRLFDNNTDLTFTRNDLQNGVGMHAVRLAPALGMPNSNVQFHFNNFERYGLSGMTVDPGGHVGTVNAECNWWNSRTGPTNPSNPGGTGERVVGDVDFIPWLTRPWQQGIRCTGRPGHEGRCDRNSDSDHAEHQELDRMNQQRSAALLPPLTMNTSSSNSARDHSCDQHQHGDFGERGSDGSMSADRMRAAGVTFTVNAENNGVAESSSGAEATSLIQSDFLGDPLASANVLNPAFTQVGIGAVYLDGVMYLTEDFTG